MVPSQKVRPRIAPRPTVRGTSARKPLGPNIVTVMASIVVDPLRACYSWMRKRTSVLKQR